MKGGKFEVATRNIEHASMETGVLKALGLRKSRHRIPLLLFAELVQLIDTGRFGFSPLPGKLPGLRNAEHCGPSCLVMQPVSRLHPAVASVFLGSVDHQQKKVQ